MVSGAPSSAAGPNGGATPASILVVDDDPEIRDLLDAYLRQEGYATATAASGGEAMDLVRAHRPDIVLLDVRLPDANGIELLRDRLVPEMGGHRVLMLSAYGTRQEVEEAVLAGAYDYLAKPIVLPRLRIAIRNCLQLQDLEQRLAEGSGERSDRASLRDVVGRSPEMAALLDQAKQVAQFDAPVMILGENGTGKELLARVIHSLSVRRRGPFVPVDCGAMPATLVEAELFGYEKGAFSGALQARPGKLERAEGGTLFLDEIGNIPIEVQPKLLRILQSCEIERLGGRHSRKIDTHIISATNADVEQMVTEGGFRRDLFHRLNTVVLRLPALRERSGDIPLLAHFALMEANRAYRKEVKAITPAAMAHLEAYAWPGNVRELENAVRSAVILANQAIEPQHLPAHVRGRPGAPSRDAAGVTPGDTLTQIGRRAAEAAQRAAILWTLEETGGNKAEAARRLGVDFKTLHVKMRLFGIQGRPKPEAGRGSKGGSVRAPGDPTDGRALADWPNFQSPDAGLHEEGTGRLR